MARTNLGALLGKVDDAPVADLTSEPPLAPEPPREVAAGIKPSVESAPAPKRTSRHTPEPQPAPYLRFVRKETRLSEDQQNQLTTHARRLNRARAGGSPRITDNTLIRVAVDLLLSRIAQAQGNDEAELLRSLN